MSWGTRHFIGFKLFEKKPTTIEQHFKKRCVSGPFSRVKNYTNLATYLTYKILVSQL